MLSGIFLFWELRLPMFIYRFTDFWNSVLPNPSRYLEKLRDSALERNLLGCCEGTARANASRDVAHLVPLRHHRRQPGPPRNAKTARTSERALVHRGVLPVPSER